MYRPAVHAPFAEDLDSVFDAVGVNCWEQLRGKQIFLTGGTGFVGKWLLASLLHADRRLGLECSVTALSRNPEAFRAEAGFLAEAPTVHLLQGDVRQFDFPKYSFDFVVHAATDVVAAASPLDIFDSCVNGTRRVLDLALQGNAARVLLISSGALYGPQPDHLTAVDEAYAGAPSVGEIRSAYGEGKRVTEWLGTAYSAMHGMDVRVARCFAFVGPYLPLDKHFALGNFMRDAMANIPIVIRGDGTALRTYLYAADMAAWLWAILLRGERSGTYNVGGEEVVSVAQLAKRMALTLKSNAQPEVQNQPTAGIAPDRYVPDVTKAKNTLCLPEPTSLDLAILKTAKWHAAFNS